MEIVLMEKSAHQMEYLRLRRKKVEGDKNYLRHYLAALVTMEMKAIQVVEMKAIQVVEMKAIQVVEMKAIQVVEMKEEMKEEMKAIQVVEMEMEKVETNESCNRVAKI